MTQALVLNALSLPFATQADAEAQIPEFLKLLAKLRPYRFNLIRMSADLDQSWHHIELSPGYFFQRWLDNHKHDVTYRDLIRSLKSFIVNQPEIFLADDLDARNTLDAGIPGDKGHDVFRACVYYGSALLSFLSHPNWNVNEVQIWVQRLEDEELKYEYLSHFSSLSTFAFHEPRLRHEQKQSLSTGKSLWELRETIFPRLCFTGKISDIKTWSHSLHILEQAQTALITLNKFCEDWNSGEYLNYQHEYLRFLGLDVSGESQSVEQDSRKRKQREFYLPTGKKVYCENHIKLAKGFRLYFYPDPTNKQIYVVYLGPHLKT